MNSEKYRKQRPLFRLVVIPGFIAVLIMLSLPWCEFEDCSIISSESVAMAKSRRKKRFKKPVVEKPTEPDSENPDSQVSLEVVAADNLMRKNAFSDAELLYGQALKSNPNSLPAILGYGMSLARQFKLQAAREQFNSALELEPKSARAHSGLAIVLYNSLQSSNPEIRERRSEILKNAEKECNKGLTIDPEMPVAYYTLGDIYRAENKLNEALKAYQKAVQLDSEFSDALCGVGLIKAEQGELDDAEASFKKAIAINSNNSTAHFGLGKIYFIGGKFKKALNELNNSLSKHSQSAPGYTVRGKVKLALGQQNSAVKDFRKALSISADMTEAYIGIARVNENNGNLREAIEVLESAPANLRDLLELRLLIAELNLKMEQPDTAISEYLKILKDLDDTNIDACHGLSLSLFMKLREDPDGDFFKLNKFITGKNLISEVYKRKHKSIRLKLCKSIVDTISGEIVDVLSLSKDVSLKDRIAFIEAVFIQAKYNKARKELSRAISKTDDLTQLLTLGDTALRLRDLDNAETAFKKIKAQPNSDFLEKRLDKAFSFIRESRKTASKRAKDAEAALEEKEIFKALNDYRTSICINPMVSATRLGLAKALKKAKPQNSKVVFEAANQYSAYIDLSPNLSKKEMKSLKSRVSKLMIKGNKLQAKESKNANKNLKENGKKSKKKKVQKS